MVSVTAQRPTQQLRGKVPPNRLSKIKSIPTLHFQLTQASSSSSAHTPQVDSILAPLLFCKNPTYSLELTIYTMVKHI